jgi:hypothetical protein
METSRDAAGTEWSTAPAYSIRIQHAICKSLGIERNRWAFQPARRRRLSNFWAISLVFGKTIPAFQEMENAEQGREGKKNTAIAGGKSRGEAEKTNCMDYPATSMP